MFLFFFHSFVSLMSLSSLLPFSPRSHSLVFPNNLITQTKYVAAAAEPPRPPRLWQQKVASSGAALQYFHILRSSCIFSGNHLFPNISQPLKCRIPTARALARSTAPGVAERALFGGNPAEVKPRLKRNSPNHQRHYNISLTN